MWLFHVFPVVHCSGCLPRLHFRQSIHNSNRCMWIIRGFCRIKQLCQPFKLGLIRLSKQTPGRARNMYGLLSGRLLSSIIIKNMPNMSEFCLKQRHEYSSVDSEVDTESLEVAQKVSEEIFQENSTQCLC